jgi:hypothetical protein
VACERFSAASVLGRKNLELGAWQSKTEHERHSTIANGAIAFDKLWMQTPCASLGPNSTDLISQCSMLARLSHDKA